MFSEPDVNVVNTVTERLNTQNLASPEVLTALKQITLDLNKMHFSKV